MNPRVIMIVDDGHVRRVSDALAAAQLQAVLESATTFSDGVKTLSDQTITGAEAFTHLAEIIKNNPPVAECCFSDQAWVLAGIAELRAWLENRIRSVLADGHQSPADRSRILFQPCWFARRWKSLT